MSLKIKQTRVGEIASVSYHYTPTEDTSAAINASGGISKDINGTSGKLNVVTGIRRDSKGHIVGVTCTNIYSSGSSDGGVGNPGATCNCELVGEYDTIGLVKNGSTITTITSDIGYVPCPIVSGVPYYQNTKDTTGVKTDVSSKLFLIGTRTNSSDVSETYRNTNVYAIGARLCAPIVSANLSGTAEKVNSNTTTSTYYLCGSTSASTSASGTLVKRSTVYVNTSGNLVAPIFSGDLSADHVETSTLHLHDDGAYGGKIVFGDISGNDMENHDRHYTCIEEIEDDTLNFKATNFNFELPNHDSQFKVNGGSIVAPTLHLYDENVEGGNSGGKIVFGDINGEIAGDHVEEHGGHYACIEEINDNELNFKATSFNFEIDSKYEGGQFMFTGGTIYLDEDCPIQGNLSGIASTATSLSVSGAVGSTTKPVYITASGRPVACSFTVSKSVPSNASFSDVNVTNNSTTSTYYLCGSASSGNTTGTLVKRSDVYVDTSGNLNAKSFYVHASAKITSDASYNMFFNVNGESPLVIANDGGSNMFVAPASSKSNKYSLGTSSRLWSAVYASKFVGYLDGNAKTATTATSLSVSGAVGSTTKPVYITASGRPVACSFNVSKSVPSDAAFTDTKNTVGITTTTSKIYLVGATSTSTTTGASANSYTNTNVFVSGGYLYSGGNKVSTTDTKNTAGTTTANSTKLFLVGGAEVASSTQTYTNSNCYIGTDNCLYSGGKKVSTTDTKNTVGASTTTSKLYFIGTTTSTSADSQQSYKNVSVYVNGTALYAAGGFYESSDERLKDFSNKIDADLDKISKIKKHKFTWKDSENKNEEIGVSAQEIRELYPEIVSENEEGYLSVAYDKLAVVALAAIDELHKKNKELEVRIELLESKLLN